METWKDIPGYPGYQASSEGRIKNSKTLNILKPQWNPSGYYYIGVRVNGKMKYPKVHRLVIAAFYGEATGLDVDHINRDKTDNRISNLRYVTRLANLGNRHNAKKKGWDPTMEEYYG